MIQKSIQLPENKKIYFASDFHLGSPDEVESKIREHKIVSWLDHISVDAHSIYLLGDIFDFWFEYRHTIPKGFIRLQGKLAFLSDKGIEINFFTGNHDMWMFNYFNKELGVSIFREPIVLCCGPQKLIVGHGDGLGQGERLYKLLKAFFNSNICQWLFARLHPNLGIAIAKFWSKGSRKSNLDVVESFKGEDHEILFNWCKQQEQIGHHDYYIFGHRHLQLNLGVSENSRYINIGDWISGTTYAIYDGQSVGLNNFEL